MAYRTDRRTATKAREARNQLANEWTICQKHGGFSPNVHRKYGWTRRECPGCARERYEAGITNDCQPPSASGA